MDKTFFLGKEELLSQVSLQMSVSRGRSYVVVVRSRDYPADPFNRRNMSAMIGQ